MHQNPKSEYSFDKILAKFLIEVNGLAESFPIITTALTQAREDINQKIEIFLEKNGELVETIEPEDDGPLKKIKKYQVAPEYAYELSRYNQKQFNFIASKSITSKGFVVTLVSQFDAFLGRLIKAVYYSKPELLSSSDKKLSFSDLIEFDSMDSARDYILEKEIESVLRESHAEHFKWLENRLGMTLKKDLDIWSDFIELTERRNLFVHTDGVISSQYIEVCKKHGVSFEKEEIPSKRLGVSEEYFHRSCELLFELSVKLTQVIWRKLKPSDLENADAHLNDIC